MAAQRKKVQEENVDRERKGEARLETAVESEPVVATVGPEHINKMLQAAEAAQGVTNPVENVPSVSGLEINPPQGSQTIPVVPMVEVEGKAAGGIPWVGVGTAFVVGMALGGLGGYGVWGGGWWEKLVAKKPMSSNQAVQKKVAMLPTVEPTVTPVPSRKDLKVLVLNGSGVKGAAAGAKEFLETLGYENLDVGNADGDDYALTEVSAKDEYFELIKTDVGSKYQLADKFTPAELGDYDAVVVVGLK